jgi:hypothetical protein
LQDQIEGVGTKIEDIGHLRIVVGGPWGSARYYLLVKGE